jgi:hypothetical protein
MEAENEVAAPQVLSPRSKKRKATKDAKEAAKLKDPVAYRAKRAEQERNRLHNKEAREAARADAARAICYVPSTPGAAAAATASRLSLTSYGATGANRLPLQTPTVIGDATFHLSLPYGLSPPPPSPIPPPILPPSVPSTIALSAQPPAPKPTPLIRDGRTFEQKRIKELELQVQNLEDAVRTRDAELKGYADVLHSTVRDATEMRDSDHMDAGSAVRGYMLAVPHKPDGPCDCVFCIGLSFLAPSLKHRAACMARMRDEKGI